MGKVKQSSTSKLQSFTEVLPAFPVMPDENPLDYQAFEIGLLADLAPQTAYEHIVARNIIANEWELMHLRRWMAAIITVHAEQQLSENISEQLDSDALKNTDADCLAKAVMQGDPQGEAHKSLQQYGIDPTRSLALAYSKQGDVVLHLEHQIMALETRRKRLRDDYRDLTQERRNIAYDADIA